MSVNYFALRPGEQGEGLHIGKHVGGREFLFRGHPDLGLVSADAWGEYLADPGVTILAESGYEVPVDEFMADATRRPAHVGGLHVMRLVWNGYDEKRDDRWRDKRGCPFAGYEFF